MSHSGNRQMRAREPAPSTERSGDPCEIGEIHMRGQICGPGDGERVDRPLLRQRLQTVAGSTLSRPVVNQKGRTGNAVQPNRHLADKSAGRFVKFDDVALGRSAVENHFINCHLQVVIPYMHRIMPRVPKLFDDPGRQHHVDQELHEPCDISGSSRSLTASAA